MQSVNESHVHVTWSRPSPPNGPIKHYLVHMKWEGEIDTTIVEDDSRTVAKILHFRHCGDGMDVQVEVVAVNEDEDGTEYYSEPSNPRTTFLCYAGIHFISTLDGKKY